MTGCKTGKARYRDRIAALLALAETQTKAHSRSPKNERRAYRCEFCAGWHLTSRGRVTEATR